MKKSDSLFVIETADERHVQSISNIYQLVKIKPERLHRIVDSLGRKPVPSQRIKPLTGFISPPDEKDMELALHNGLTLICVLNNEVIGYNRVVTQADKVHQQLCAEFRINPALREFGYGQFSNWSGDEEKHAGKVLKRLRWIDKKQASIAFQAAIAGLENRESGRLGWSMDAAVLPESQNLGVSKALMQQMNNELSPKFKYRVFRIFEICTINDTEIIIANVPSQNTFINSSSKQFAWTEEEITIDPTLTLRVRWNHWLKQF